MAIFRELAMFLLGGSGYVLLELLWRGRSHFSMFLAGGVCFLLLGWLRRRLTGLSFPVKGLLGALTITAVELAAGLIFNRDYAVWDYRGLPFHFLGQICLPYTLLWIPVSIAAMWLHTLLERRHAQ